MSDPDVMLTLLALWIDRAQATNAEARELLGAGRCACIAYALGRAHGEVLQALEEIKKNGPRETRGEGRP